MSIKNTKKINKYRSLFPNDIEVLVRPCKQGGFYAEIKTFPGCYTQAETFSELIEMVNDAVVTVLEIPKECISFMPTYLPPTSLAQLLNIFPTPKVVERPVTFSIL